MIEITQLIKSLDDIDTNFVYAYNQALQGKYYQKNGAWYDKVGRKAGDTAQEVCEKFNLSPTKITPDRYFAVEPHVIDTLVNTKTVLIDAKGTYVVGLYEGGMTEQELREHVNG